MLLNGGALFLAKLRSKPTRITSDAGLHSRSRVGARGDASWVAEYATDSYASFG